MNTHCHCWDDDIGPCCWCDYNGDDNPICPVPHPEDADCRATLDARRELGWPDAL